MRIFHFVPSSDLAQRSVGSIFSKQGMAAPVLTRPQISTNDRTMSFVIGRVWSYLLLGPDDEEDVRTYPLQPSRQIAARVASAKLRPVQSEILSAHFFLGLPLARPPLTVP